MVIASELNVRDDECFHVQHGKQLRLWSIMPPHMLSFHINWVSSVGRCTPVVFVRFTLLYREVSAITRTG